MHISLRKFSDQGEVLFMRIGVNQHLLNKAYFLSLFPTNGIIGEHVTYLLFPRCGKSVLVKVIGHLFLSHRRSVNGTHFEKIDSYLLDLKPRPLL